MSFVVVILAAFVAGAINAVAGGGTLLTFPSLIWAGLPSTIANATSTVAIWPGSLGGMWGYRRDLTGLPDRTYALIVPSLVGGLVGAILLVLTPTRVFDRLIPFLVLFATVMFMVQEPVQRLIKTTGAAHGGSSREFIGALLFQFLVGVYGGYFGAGIGILMLAAFGFLGFTDIHQMNGLKAFLALCMNGVAAIYFIWNGMVSWPHALLMALAAIVGGVWGAGVARRIGPKGVRRIVIGVGFTMAFSLLLRL